MSLGIPVNLNAWTAETWPDYASNLQRGPPIWTISGDEVSVFQSENPRESVFCSDFDAMGLIVEGTIVVETANDNDFIGFTFGYELGDSTADPSTADFLLLDWKQADQNFNFGCTQTLGEAGIAISQVIGIPIPDEFWSHSQITPTTNPSCAFNSAEPAGLAELLRGVNLGSVGWADQTEYLFRFEFDDDELKVFVDGTLEITLLDTSSYEDGKFCFYNFSQEKVRYKGFTQREIVPPDVLCE